MSKLQPLYTKKYASGSDTVTVRGFEIPIPMPVCPPDKEILNYGLPEEKQKFQREKIPTGREWELMDDKAKHDFAADQWHKRINGAWWFIKGQRFYIPGNAWFFFNYWEMSSGGKPDFRFEAVEYFWVCDFINRHKVHLGKYVIKSRRIGESEKELCDGYNETTMFRYSNFGMMNVNEEEAKGNYLRLLHSYKEMHPIFQPFNKSKDPQTGLYFKADDAPRDGEPPAINSRVAFRPTKKRAFDGWRLRRIHWDEIGKLMPSDIEVEPQWAILKECITLNNGMKKVGTGSLTTTVENFGSGKTVAVCNSIWKKSDPGVVDGMGRTLTGLVRYFRGYWCSAPVDEWGFHDVEAATANRIEKIKAYIAAGDFEGLSDYKRKYPETIEDALSIPEGLCTLHPVLLDTQLDNMLIMEERRKNPIFDEEAHNYPIATRGDLVWESKVMGPVKWVPNPTSGKFWISQHPTIPNHCEIHQGLKFPGNKGVYTMGVDPVDHVKGSRGGSDFAIAVFRTLDYQAETNIQVQESASGMEVMNKHAMITNRFVCTYSNRPVDPRIAYEDALKCAIYYGIPAFVENNKPGIIFFFETIGANNYMDWKNPLLRVGASRAVMPGMPTSNASSQLWQDILKQHVYLWSETYVHRDQLKNFRQFTGDNATDCDLVVASGFAIAQSKAVEYSQSTKREKWHSLPFETYN